VGTINNGQPTTANLVPVPETWYQFLRHADLDEAQEARGNRYRLPRPILAVLVLGFGISLVLGIVLGIVLVFGIVLVLGITLVLGIAFVLGIALAGCSPDASIGANLKVWQGSEPEEPSERSLSGFARPTKTCVGLRLYD
jgi:hypothetical protein